MLATPVWPSEQLLQKTSALACIGGARVQMLHVGCQVAGFTLHMDMRFFCAHRHVVLRASGASVPHATNYSTRRCPCVIGPAGFCLLLTRHCCIYVRSALQSAGPWQQRVLPQVKKVGADASKGEWSCLCGHGLVCVCGCAFVRVCASMREQRLSVRILCRLKHRRFPFPCRHHGCKCVRGCVCCGWPFCREGQSWRWGGRTVHAATAC